MTHNALARMQRVTTFDMRCHGWELRTTETRKSGQSLSKGPILRKAFLEKGQVGSTNIWSTTEAVPPVEQRYAVKVISGKILQKEAKIG